jgi:hypothetical protein
MERVVELFGVDRVVWGSDWPICTLAIGLGNWTDISSRFLNELSNDEAMKISQTNATGSTALKAESPPETKSASATLTLASQGPQSLELEG